MNPQIASRTAAQRLPVSTRGRIQPANLQQAVDAAQPWSPAASSGGGLPVPLPVIAGGVALLGLGAWWFLIRKKR